MQKEQRYLRELVQLYLDIDSNLSEDKESELSFEEVENVIKIFLHLRRTRRTILINFNIEVFSNDSLNIGIRQTNRAEEALCILDTHTNIWFSRTRRIVKKSMKYVAS